MLEKSQVWVEAKPSTQSLINKFDFGNSNQKSRKDGYQTSLFLSNITGFLNFIPNILSGIVGANKSFMLTQPSLIQTSFF